MSIKRLKDIISMDDRFKNSVNLQLDLYKTHKAEEYIPTKSSLNILNKYFDNVNNKKDNATILIGPYGKGKSHLLLVLLTVLRLKRKKENERIVNKLIDSFFSYDKEIALNLKKIWETKKRFLPVIISSTQGDLNQAFLVGLNEALIKAGLQEIVPNTSYTEAIKVIDKWKNEYKETYDKFELELKEDKRTVNDFVASLKLCEKTTLEAFQKLYPGLTSGGIFNPLVNSEMLSIYKNINDIICNEYGYNGTFIVFDEFSKYIESHDRATVSNDMKIIQDICELATDSGENQIHITLVTHKSVKEYGNTLPNEIINNFIGIEGRVKEIYFVSSFKNNYELIKNAIKKDERKLDELDKEYNLFNKDMIEKYYYNIPCFKTMFLEQDFVDIVVKGCFPLSPITAYVLLNISEKVAQNERTLFTFISKDEPYSMANYINKSLSGAEFFVGLDLIYDYFKPIFKKDVANIVVHNEWLKAEYVLGSVTDNKCKIIIKALALINIINKFDELPPSENTLLLASNLGGEGVEILEILEKKNLVYKKSSTGLYIFKSGVGADIKSKIKAEKILIGENFDICNGITSAIGMEYILPKQYNQEYAMTRYFVVKYMLYKDFLELAKSDYLFEEKFADGYVIKLVCNEEEILNNILLVENKLKELGDRRIIILLPRNFYQYKELIQEYVAIQKIITNKEFVDDNRVLMNELELFEEDIIYGINDYLHNSFNLDKGYCYSVSYVEDNTVVEERTDLNRMVSRICRDNYLLTPKINNEMINKKEITSAAIKKARKVIIERILEDDIDETFYLGTSPEATIFRSVIKNTGVLDGEPENEMGNILKEINQYIASCEKKKTDFVSLFNGLTSAPYGLRMGVIPIILSYVFMNRNEDIVIYLKNKEQDLNSDTILNICDNPQSYFLYVEDGTNEKREYLELLMKLFGVPIIVKPYNSNFSQLALEMQRWFKSLPQITRSLKIDANELYDGMRSGIKFKDLLQKVDINPYELIYKNIPEVLELKDYSEIVNQVAGIKHFLEYYHHSYINDLILTTKKVFSGKNSDGLATILKSWYDDQSLTAKQGLYEGHISELLNYIGNVGTYDDTVIVKKVAKIVSGLHIETWNGEIKAKYIDDLKSIRYQVESIIEKEIPDEGKLKLTFVDSNSKEVVKYYKGISENSGYYLRNMISEAIDDFGDSVSLNDKVAVLVEMLEKVLK